MATPKSEGFQLYEKLHNMEQNTEAIYDQLADLKKILNGIRTATSIIAGIFVFSIAMAFLMSAMASSHI